jgi:hypothetical protein
MKKPIKQSLEEHAPWLPAPYELADVGAIQALARGDAPPDAQKRALRWIIENAAGTYEQSYRPGPEGERDTAFAEGRRHVGLNIVKLLKLNLQAMRDKT